MVEKGYTFVKGKSRSKRLASSDDTPRATRVKISTEIRAKRIAPLKEDIANIDQQLIFKEKRHQQAEGIRNYRVCDEITEEIGLVKQQRRKLSDELNMYRKKERKAKWYQTAKQVKRASTSSSRTSSVTSDESDYHVISPASSVPSTSDGTRETSAEGEHNEGEAGGDAEDEYNESEVGGGEHDGINQVFHQGLPVEQQ